MTEKAIISIKDLTKKYGNINVLKDISLDINKGEIFGVSGENGAGKSTLLAIAAGVIPPTRGEITIKEMNVQNQSKIKGIIGYVPQDISLYLSLTGMDNLKFWGRVYGVKGKLLQERIREVLEIVELGEKIKSPAASYSGGMKRRLNLGVALLHRPEILILDEPTAGVDVNSRECILEAVREMSRKGCTVLYTSHYLNEMEACDRVAVLRSGEVTELKDKEVNEAAIYDQNNHR